MKERQIGICSSCKNYTEVAHVNTSWVLGAVVPGLRCLNCYLRQQRVFCGCVSCISSSSRYWEMMHTVSPDWVAEGEGSNFVV